MADETLPPVSNMTPAEIAAADQEMARLVQIRSTITDFAHCIHLAGQVGNQQAMVVAHQHIGAVIMHMREHEVYSLVTNLLLNIIEHVATSDVAAQAGGYWNLLDAETRESIEAFVASDGRDCCEVGPEGHDWAAYRVTE